jgi:predicted transcriptional regulator
MSQQKLTPVEWEIMESVWELSDSVAARDVVRHTYPSGEKAYTTVQTIMNTLHRKGLLNRNKIGMVNFYTPTRTRTSMVKEELTHFISRVFDGSVQALANFLVDLDNLELRDIQELKLLIEKKEKAMRRSDS